MESLTIAFIKIIQTFHAVLEVSCIVYVAEIPCNEGMEYKSCGNPCQASCSLETPACVQRCVEGCFCKAGLVLDGDRCVRPVQCGCEMDGLYYHVR